MPMMLLGAWWVLGSTGVLVPLARLPDPLSIVDAIADLLTGGSLPDHLRVSMVRVGSGFVIGSATGLALRAGVRRWRGAGTLFTPVVAVLRAVPSVAWVPLLVLVLGVGEPAIVPLIAAGAATGILSSHGRRPRHLRGGATSAGRRDLVRAMRRALRQSWLVVAMAELLGAREGLGFLLAEAGRDGSGVRFWAVMIVVSVLAGTSELLLGLGAIPASSRGFHPARTAS